MSNGRSSSSGGPPPVRVLVFVAFILTIAAAALMLAYLTTDPANRPNVWLYVPAGLSIVPAVMAWLRGEQNRRTLADQTEQTVHLTRTVDAIHRNTAPALVAVGHTARSVVKQSKTPARRRPSKGDKP